jgi:glycosyltransferase involved in cell wall biosynthesis
VPAVEGADLERDAEGRRFPVVLVAVGRYLPGFKAGGPIRSVANLVERLGEEFSFKVVTRDRDLGDDAPYPDVVPGQWQQVGKAQVRYLGPQELSPRAWRRLLTTTRHDVLYLSSFFDRPTVWTVLLRRLGLVPGKPIVLAPRGEFSARALATKRLRKRAYLRAVAWSGALRGVVFQASAEHEAAEIAAALAAVGEGSPRVFVAPDVSLASPTNGVASDRPLKRRGEANIAFVGRVARIKNLGYALKLLRGIEGRIRFEVIGPIEDAGYLRECLAASADLAPGTVMMRGSLSPAAVRARLGESHLLLLPTCSENFGHAILEALTAGCPVLISDRTRWRDLESRQAGWDLPLDQPEAFRSALRRLISMDEGEYAAWSEGAAAYAASFYAAPSTLDMHREIFRDCLVASDQ